MTDIHFGALKVIKDSKKRKNSQVLWLCLCACGNEKLIRAPHLITGKTQSCGCKRSPSLVEKKYGMLTVISETDKKYHNYRVWDCICDCGKRKDVSTLHLKNRSIRSCGCLAEGENLVGEKFNKWTVLALSNMRLKNNHRLWICECKCGRISSVSGGHLKTEHSKGCRDCSHRRGKEHHNWKNGISSLNKYLRNKLTRWKEDSYEKYGRKCFISGEKSGLEIHHLNASFNQILIKTMRNVNLQINEDISYYTELELESITEALVEIHYKNGLGIPIPSTLHNKLHSQYGNNCSSDDFWEFFCRKL